MQTKVLLFGGAGYLGSILTNELLGRGYSVRLFDSFIFGDQSINHLRENNNLECIKGDIRDIKKVSDAMEGVDAVIHLVGIVGETACNKEPKTAIEVNLVATQAIAGLCKYHKIKRFMFASSDSAYGIKEGIMQEEDNELNPISSYACHKMISEKDILSLIDDDGFSPCILRMATLYGVSYRMRFDLIMNILVKHAVLNKKISIFGGKQWRPLVHVRDAAEAYIRCLETPTSLIKGQIFNVGSNEQNYQICQLGRLVQDAMPEIKIETIDKPPDLRDYHVSFDKIGRVLNHNVRWGIKDGIMEIRKSIEKGTFGDCTDKRFYNA